MAVSERVASRLRRMSLEQKVGQVFMVGLDPTSSGRPDSLTIGDPYTALTAGVAGLLAEMHAGGVVYFERNVESPVALAALSAALQANALRHGDPGLIIAIDQEGGRVSRLREARGFTEFPSPMALGATGDPANARRMAAAMAGELKDAGINMDLAPVLDVNSNPANPIVGVRSFGSDPARVAEFGLAFVDGLQAAGLMAVGKHVPGHGDTGVDTHYALPAIAHPRARLDAVELAPFRAAMRAGVAGIMSAHITVPAVEPTPGLPATLSTRVMTELVRHELGHQGLLLTDSLEMGALATSGYPVPQAAAAALAAGADLLCISHGFEIQRDAYNEVVRQVRAGSISEARLAEAVSRVLSAKERYGILDLADPRRTTPAVPSGTAATRELARALAAAAVTVVRDDRGLLPLSPAATLVVDGATGGRLGHALGCETIALKSSAGPWAHPLDAGEILAHAGTGRTLLVATADVWRRPEQAALVNALVDAGAPVVAAATGAPYDLLSYPRVPAFVASYGANPPALAALAAVLRGDAAARGRLPVELPGLAPVGTGL